MCNMSGVSLNDICIWGHMLSNTAQVSTTMAQPCFLSAERAPLCVVFLLDSHVHSSKHAGKKLSMQEQYIQLLPCLPAHIQYPARMLTHLRFHCPDFYGTGVVSSKLAQPLIQRKNGKSAHFNWTEELTIVQPCIRYYRSLLKLKLLLSFWRTVATHSHLHHSNNSLF
jgi:hypothetical protein